MEPGCSAFAVPATRVDDTLKFSGVSNAKEKNDGGDADAENSSAFVGITADTAFAVMASGLVAFLTRGAAGEGTVVVVEVVVVVDVVEEVVVVAEATATTAEF
ncbi:MAG: hypothetical protein RLZ18_760 [Actinomycetota bacterium]